MWVVTLSNWESGKSYKFLSNATLDELHRWVDSLNDENIYFLDTFQIIMNKDSILLEPVTKYPTEFMSYIKDKWLVSDKFFRYR